MKTTSLLSLSYLLLILLIVSSCGGETKKDNNGISTDEAAIAAGQATFEQTCGTCHNFMQAGIGPQLGGLTKEVSADWIKKFIKNPQGMIDAGDERAVTLFKQYNSYMPAFSYLSDEQIDQVIAYINTKDGPAFSGTNAGEALQNPIPDTIQTSDITVEIKEITSLPPSGKAPLINRETKMDQIPGTDRSFVVDLRGKLYELVNGEPRVYMDMEALQPKFINTPGHGTGFGSFAFHPEFTSNGLLYTTHTEPAGSAPADFAYADSIRVKLQWVLTEWTTDPAAKAPFKASKSKELFRINMVTQIHGMQDIRFNPTVKRGDADYGLLYIGLGDGGASENGYPFLIDNLETAWGSIFRIDPAGNNSKNGQYGIPASNPFVNESDPNTVKEIYAKGFRNPHRLTWLQSGEMLASNIGHHMIEALYIILPGHNYGWPYREGSFIINPYDDMNKVYARQMDPNDPITYPVAEYDHDEGNAILGGYEYTGSDVPELKGKYVFGDIVHGWLAYVNVSDLKLGQVATIKKLQVSMNGQPVSFKEMNDGQKVDLRLGTDAAGELYIFTKSNGKAYKVVSSKPM
ncbi:MULTISPECIES: PQQ-dependent sugar dehydrogenase [unclassified Imperialibacter]|uniref:PQQ-dependent sugar dehydrogenase n=1 Tax=unclassified Imperialibacter TaxID=2629706 RepID=UPI00125A694B|nr:MULTISPECIES: PQQ-dependent sugar dehydrogenase [unclassified Imperialibacter]CAD5282403.1 Cytochrome C [Imperialibacter sp. 89]CAD5287237.1 Cytochrome C [Imperialibacter sp. 75]VVT30517.1 Cytochrome c [Imperialibacter sp. EC-SDR9]